MLLLKDHGMRSVQFDPAVLERAGETFGFAFHHF